MQENTTPLFRQGTPGDYEAVRAFYHLVTDHSNAQAYGPYWQKDIHPSRELMASSLEQGNLYLMETDGRIVAAMVLNHAVHPGYTGVSFPSGAGLDEVYVLHLLAVHPDYAGRGYAKELLQRAKDIAIQHHMKAIRLDVLTTNLSAVRLYQRCGYVQAAYIPGMYDVFVGPVDGELYELCLEDGNTTC